MGKENNKLEHIAIIMDGNGRWAKERGMERYEGHKEGVKTFETIADLCFDLGIDHATFYAFSTENWKRPKKEVDTIMSLLSFYLDILRKKLREKKIRLNILGDTTKFSPTIIKKMEICKKESEGYTRTLNLALNYGGRDEMVHACNKLISEGKKEITAEDISNSLYTAGIPDPDMIVRTGGEKRLSNFLLWQSSYAELYFTDKLWPDFSEDDLKEAIEYFYQRNRRFGGV